MTRRLEDMRIFAAVALANSFTGAGKFLGLPKQTVSRRVADLEASLGTRLLHRTTRRLRFTDVGGAYAERCAEVVRLADDANDAVTRASTSPRGTLRVTADPLFGDAFVSLLVVEYAATYPEATVEVLITQRRVDLVEEGFDVAFRVGTPDEASLVSKVLGPAQIRYCASPAYLAEWGAPKAPEDLTAHRCIMLTSGGGPDRWPFRNKRKGGTKAIVSHRVDARIRVNNFAVARRAALAGLGIANIPAFACADDILDGGLVPLLDDWAADFGQVFMIYPANRYLAARVRAFVELAENRLGREQPWLVRRNG